MKVYDNYEISPCKRYEQPDSPGRFHFEVCEPHEADVWTLYGHLDGEGVEAIGDFSTREHAEETLQRITGIPFAGTGEVAARLRVMHAGPKLLEANTSMLDLVRAAAQIDAPFIRLDEMDTQIALAAEAVTEATGNARMQPRKPIVIEVRGGVVQDVQNVPPGYQYEVKDYDNIEAKQKAAPGGTEGTVPPSTLPPDPEGMNDKRAEWASRAITAFQDATGTEDEDALGDLLTDLMHWADRNQYDFEAALFRGRDHYEAETIGDIGEEDA